MKVKNNSDYVVVGGGLIGLLLYKKLQDSGQSVILLEKQGKVGGSLLEEGSQQEFSFKVPLWTNNIFPSVFEYSTLEGPILTLGKNGATPFVGFGDQKIEALDAVNLFSEGKLHLPQTLKVDGDFLQSNGIYCHSEVLKISRSENHEIKINVNGKQDITTKNLIWTCSAQNLDQSIAPGELDKTKQKIKKAKFYDCILLETPRLEISEVENTRYLFFGENQPTWIGSSFNSPDKMTWACFMDQRSSADHDVVRKALKALEKCIKKVSPESETKLSREKISFIGSSLSELNFLNKNYQLKDWPNLFFLGSSKNTWPSPLEGKLSAIESVHEFLCGDLSEKPLEANA